MAAILITGVSGFIGCNLAEALLKRGHQVLGFDNMSNAPQRNVDDLSRFDRFRFIRADVLEREAVRSAAVGMEWIIHLAAGKIPRYSDATDTLLVNSMGTHNVLHAAEITGARVLAASTSDVYGNNPDTPFDEFSDKWFGPSTVRRWAYAVSKLFDEQIGFAFMKERGVQVCLVRFFGGYGPRQALSWLGGPQSVFIAAALRGEPLEIHGDGQQTRSFTYIDDHVEWLVRCIERPEASCGQVFNFGNTEVVTIEHLARTIWELAGSGDPRLNFISYRTFGKYQDVRHRVPDAGRAGKLLGYQAQVPLQEGLRRTIAWQRSVTGQ
jgi:nucleoside-diphosphate-sugar epimerase